STARPFRANRRSRGSSRRCRKRKNHDPGDRAMQLERLRLAGFKSFVEPAELAIESGLTGIVGPNGCGKSNLVEALRWAMGEASARRLRGGEMGDVIFARAGARARWTMGSLPARRRGRRPTSPKSR